MYEVISAFGSVFGALFALGAMLVPFYLRWRDKQTYLKITYSLGEPEYPADLNDIAQSECPDPGRAAFYVKIPITKYKI